MRRIFGLTLILWAILGCPGARAQSSPGFGTVTGAVVDAYGEGIPDTKVILTNANKGIERTFMTSDDGIFYIAGIAPSDGYTLKLQRTGFASWETGTFEVPLGPPVYFLIPISPQTPPTHVEASVVMPTMETTKNGINQEVTPRQLNELPSPNQRWVSFTALAPWVGAFNPIFTSPTSPPYLLIDGAKVSNSFNPNTGAPERVAQDAVQAVDVLANGFPAAFPSSFGGIADVATRNGALGYHGDAYDFFSDGGMAAADRYAAGFKPAEHRHQGGASLAAPVYRRHIFFFGNYEGIYGQYEGLNRITNPTIADPTGMFVLPSNCKGTVTQCAAAAKFIQSRMNVIVPRTVHSGTAFAKLDFYKGDRHTVSLEANGSRWISPSGAQNEAVSTDGSLLGANGNLREDSRFVRGSWVGTPHATTVNELRLSWSRDDVTGTPATQLYPGATGALGIEIAGTQVGAAQGYPFTYPDERRREVSDSFTKAFNTQVMRFGVDVSWIEDSLQKILDGGMYNYTSLTAFAQDFSGITVGRKTYTSYSQQFGIPQRTQRIVDFGSYFQDTWRVFSRLSIIFGARYEKQLMPTPTALNPTYYETGKIPSPNIDGGPRVGISYAANPTTVFRAGYDWFFAPYPGQAVDALEIGSNQNLGTVLVTPAQTGAPIFPNAYTSALSIPKGVASVTYANLRLRDPRSAQLDISMEKVLAKDTFFTVAVAATRGIRLWTLNDLNFAPPTKAVTYTIDNTLGVPTAFYNSTVWSGKSDLNSSNVYEVDSVARSSRNALTLQLRKRFGDSLNVQGVYTWEHCTDDAGYPINGVAGVTSVPGDPAPDKGSSAYDQRHRAVLNWTWEPKAPAGAFPIARQLLSGWVLSGVATWATGLPHTEQVMVQGQQVSGAPMVYTNSLNGSGGWDRVPFDQISTLRPGPMYPVNARLARTVRFGERVRAQLMVEAFNVFNTQFNTSVNTIAYTASGGILKPAAFLGAGNASYGQVNGTNARSGQLALKITF